VKSIQLAKLQEQLGAGQTLLGRPGSLPPVGEGDIEDENEGDATHEPAPAARRTFVKKEARVNKVELAVKTFLEQHSVEHVILDASQLVREGNPFLVSRPPSSFHQRAQMCGVDSKALAKSLYMLYGVMEEGQEGPSQQGLVRVVAPPEGYLNFESCASAIRELFSLPVKQKLQLQVASASDMRMLSEVEGLADCCCSGEDLRQCALNYKICPPVCPPALSLLIAEESQQTALLFEIGFGKYIQLSAAELVRSCGATVVCGLVKNEPTAMPFREA